MDDVFDQDFIVSSLLSELKEENTRKDKLVRNLIKVICGCLVAILMTVAGFLWYLNQYDFSSSVSATGVYTLVDSEGNVIAADLSPQEIMEVLDSYGQSNQSQNQD